MVVPFFLKTVGSLDRLSKVVSTRMPSSWLITTRVSTPVLGSISCRGQGRAGAGQGLGKVGQEQVGGRGAEGELKPGRGEQRGGNISSRTVVVASTSPHEGAETI